jgi:CO/xanthine dehydrogenase Mo-binding subunit
MVPFDAITMVMGDTDLTPYDQGTFGSQSTPQMGPRLRTMAAAARQTLVDMAAKQWSCDAAALIVANGKITAPNANQSLTYGELTRAKSWSPPSPATRLSLRPRIGRSPARPSPRPMAAIL